MFGTNENTEVKRNCSSSRFPPSDKRTDASAATRQYFYSPALSRSSRLTRLVLFITDVRMIFEEKLNCYVEADVQCCSLWRVGS